MRWSSLLVVALALAVGSARAQSLPLLAAAPAMPPSAAAPAAWRPASAGSPALASADLERRGQSRRTVGTVLMAIGIPVMVLGAILYVHGVLESRSGTDRAITDGEQWSGAAAGGVGLAALAIGIPLYVVGNRQVERARRLRGGITLLPSAGRSPGGGVVSLTGDF